MKQISSRMGMVSAAVAAMLSAGNSQFLLSKYDPRSANSIAARIGSYAPRQASPISPSRRFRSQAEANQRKESAALKRERRAVKRYSQYCSTIRGVMRDLTHGWVAKNLNNGLFSDEGLILVDRTHFSESDMSVWQKRAVTIFTNCFKQSPFEAYRTLNIDEVNHA